MDVLRDTAGAPQPTTKQPIGHWNGPKMPIFGQKCQFWAKFGRFWAKNPFFGGVE